jgi:hypothetical protein
VIVVVDHHEPRRNAPEKHHDPQKHSRKRSVTLSCRRELGIIVRTMLDEPHRPTNTFGEYTVTITAMSLGPPVERSTVAVLVLVLAVVLAGCGMPFTGGDGGTTSPSVTPAPVPTDEPTPTPVPQLAPGLDGTGVTDPFALAEAHASVLDGTAYTVQTNVTVRYANGTVYTQQSTDSQLAANRTRYYVVNEVAGARIGGGQAGTSLYSDGERVFVARTSAGRTTYRIARGVDREPAPPGELLSGDEAGDERIYSLFTAVETRIADETSRNGTTRYRIVGANVTGEADPGSRYGDPRNVTAHATIDSRGLVNEYRLRYEGAVDGANVTVVRRARYIDVGSTTVERPPWYEAAIRNVTTATPDATGARSTAAPPTTATTAGASGPSADAPATATTDPTAAE